MKSNVEKYVTGGAELPFKYTKYDPESSKYSATLLCFEDASWAWDDDEDYA